MGKAALYTIGYGARELATFISVLQKYEITFLIDIRSRPYSRYKPEFSKQALAEQLRQAGIRYVYMGDALGGQPEEPACYVDGKVDYEKVKEQPFYQRGLERLREAERQGLRVVLMCSEGKPEQCHRSKLIGQSLDADNVPVVHIDENDDEVSQQIVMTRLHRGQMALDFGEDVFSLTSRKRYRQEDEDA